MLRSFARISQCILSKNNSLKIVKGISNLPAISTIKLNCNFIQKSSFSTKGESGLASVLKDELKSEKDTMRLSSVPKNFTIKESKGSEITLLRKYDDGLIGEVKIDLAGSVGVNEDESHDADQELQSLPEFTISLIKQNKRTIRFNCSLNVEPQELEGDDVTPTYSVESVEVDSVPGYYTVSEVLDMKIFENLTDLLIERGFDLNFQNELQLFCTAEEHKLYCKFLEGLKQFCI